MSAARLTTPKPTTTRQADQAGGTRSCTSSVAAAGPVLMAVGILSSSAMHSRPHTTSASSLFPAGPVEQPRDVAEAEGNLRQRFAAIVRHCPAGSDMASLT